MRGPGRAFGTARPARMATWKCNRHGRLRDKIAPQKPTSQKRDVGHPRLFWMENEMWATRLPRSRLFVTDLNSMSDSAILRSLRTTMPQVAIDGPMAFISRTTGASIACTAVPSLMKKAYWLPESCWSSSSQPIFRGPRSIKAT